VGVAMLVATVVGIAYLVVAIVADVPEDTSGGRPAWPGQGFVLLVGIGVVGLVSLVDAFLAGRRRR
jgi:hypothetical protein